VGRLLLNASLVNATLGTFKIIQKKTKKIVKRKAEKVDEILLLQE